ncbi:DUF7344 domain-containing protein [Halocatena halophila]|uniref:DUF7344 domain-containing protein n=1 Tax=Halocatena halophila TaxID=2814576 RepID=UPI002ED23F7E
MSPVANTDPGGETERTTAPTATSTDGADTQSSLSKDELFHLLQNKRRRRVLEFLQGTDGAVDMREIAEQVAAWENETTVSALDSNERQRVYIALYQSHLPKLDGAGVLSYNQERGIVKRTPLADQLDVYLNVKPSDQVCKINAETVDHASVPRAVETAHTAANDDWRLLADAGVVTAVSALAIGAQTIGVISLAGPLLASLVLGGFLLVIAGHHF